MGLKLGFNTLPRFCKDCKHAKAHKETHDEHGSRVHYECVHPKTLSFDLVTGTQNYRSCHQARRVAVGACGPEGALYEPLA